VLPAVGSHPADGVTRALQSHVDKLVSRLALDKDKAALTDETGLHLVSPQHSGNKHDSILRMHQREVVRHWLKSRCPVFCRDCRCFGRSCAVWLHRCRTKTRQECGELTEKIPRSRQPQLRHRDIRIGTPHMQQPSMRHVCHGAEKEGGVTQRLDNDDTDTPDTVRDAQ
jgi:hypothetical protein